MKDGGPVSPVASQIVVEGDRANVEYSGGMSLRDYFAAAALAGQATAAGFQGAPWDVLAREAYMAADSMLAEREKERA